MRRYGFLTKADTYEALNRLRDAFLAAKDGNEVNEIINGLFTDDEKIKIGRRIQIAESLTHDAKYNQISQISNVGFTTILWVSRQLTNYPKCFDLLFKRRTKVEKVYQSKKFISTSLYPKGRKEYSGIKRIDIKR